MEEVEKVFRSLRHRMSWTNANKVLRAAGVSTSYGWNATLQKIADTGQKVDVGKLENALIEHLLCGQKFTKLYSIDDNKRQKLQRTILNYELEDCPATSSFPHLMSDSDLSSGTGEMRAIQSIKNDDGVGLLLSSVFWIKKREEISFQEFENPTEMQGRYDEVVGIVRQPVQMFFVVWVPHHRDYLEIRVDSPRGLVDADLHGMHSILRVMVNNWGDIGLVKPVDLFPAVRPFYEDATEGTVTQMTFQTTTGGIKDEKLPRRRKDADQRTEAYHVAGRDAVEAISIYRISVEWGFTVDRIVFAPSITLAASGPSGHGASGNPTISGALIENCVRAADYEFVIERLGTKAKLDSLSVA